MSNSHGITPSFEFSLPPEPIHLASCDFCDDDDPAFAYETEDVDVWLNGLVRAHLSGPWRACVTCSDLIEAGDYRELARRATGRDQVDAHGAFKAARVGPRRALSME